MSESTEDENSSDSSGEDAEQVELIISETDISAEKMTESDDIDQEITISAVPEDALVYNGHSYYVYADVCDSWDSAEEYCERLGGHLAIIHDLETNSLLYGYIQDMGFTTAYFGLYKSAAEEWIWIDGTSMDYEYWADGEPSGDGLYGCFYYKYTYGNWNDADFGNGGTAFICEWDGVVSGGTFW